MSDRFRVPAAFASRSGDRLGACPPTAPPYRRRRRRASPGWPRPATWPSRRARRARPRGLAADRRQAAHRAEVGGVDGRRRRRGDAQPAARGRRPGARARARRRSSTPPPPRRGLDPRRAAAAAAHADGRPGRPRRRSRRPACSADAGLERLRPRAARRRPLADGDDVSVGDLVAARLGDEVVDRLVEPLLGGVYAGHARAALRARRPCRSWSRSGAATASLARAAAARPPRPPRRRRCSPGSRGGLGRLPARRWRDGGSRSAPARPSASCVARPTRLGRSSSGRPATPRRSQADAVVLATPAAPTARLLGRRRARRGRRAGRGRVRLDGHRHAGVPRRGRARTCRAPASWCRRSTAATIKAVDVLLRQVGLGPRGRRDGAAGAAHLARPAPRGATLQRTDEELVGASLADLAEAIGLAARPVDTHVQRWGGGAAAVRRRPPRPGRPDPRAVAAAARAGGLRGGVRRGRHPRRASPRPAGRPPGPRRLSRRQNDDP